jgi:hypothetical protein
MITLSEFVSALIMHMRPVLLCNMLRVGFCGQKQNSVNMATSIKEKGR